MLDADGLDAGHFMILKGGMVPGVWSRQFAFGEAGRSNADRQWLIPAKSIGILAKGISTYWVLLKQSNLTPLAGWVGLK